MYNEQLEQLIDAALADGVLTEKEKQILFKKAQAFGVDLDEFEMVLDARLVKLQKEQQAAAPKSNKFGDVRKCPACGSLVPSLSGVCQECGYEFSGVDANLSSKALSAKIEEINEQQAQKAEKVEDEDIKWEYMVSGRVSAVAQAIKSFPVPNTKADMFEFITTMQSNMLNPSIYKLEGEAYFTKYNETIIKASSLYKNDPTISGLIENKNAVIDEFKKINKKQKKIEMKPSAKTAIIGGAIVALVMLFCGIMAIVSQ